ncbi:unnamed protein product [Trifolium pratense]|uniref:Uncharacterized protein n=1 Tax=Trifolium pratense TaxID=57577 RepID=A0ACB0JJL4_TRIPR|nr:unnamed protein product [Trifolium pratense]
MGEGSWENLWTIKTVLRGFELVSGLKINFTKSKLYALNVDDRFLAAGSAFLSCRSDVIPFKFLGIPVGANPRRRETWRPVVEAMSKRLSSWCGRHLSYGGRITLINSVLASLPLYFFSFFKAPVCVLKQLVRIQRNFLWGGGLEDKKLCWVKWEQICMPRDQGGLGVKNLELFNLALLSKWKWRCVNESDAVWTDVLRFRYGHLPSKFLNEELYSCGAKDSIWWRDLVNVGDSFLPGWFKSNVSCIVGNGKNINFWKNKWFGNNSFSELFPTLFSKDACSEAMIADRLNNSTDEITWSWDWRVPLSLQEEQELFSLKELLRGFSLKPDCCDKWRWMSESDGLFTVKSCYKMLLQDDNCDAISAESLVAIRKLWKNDLPSKVGVFGWRLLLEKLPTRVALAHRVTFGRRFMLGWDCLTTIRG